MRLNKVLTGTSVAIVLAIGFTSQYFSTFAQGAQKVRTAGVAVGPQYDTTHVYVAPQDFDRFVASLIATFGGTTTKQGVFTVTPTPSSTMSQLVLTTAGDGVRVRLQNAGPVSFRVGAHRLSGHRH